MPSNKPAKRPIPSALAGRPLYDHQPKGWLKLSEVMQVLQVSQRQVQRFQTERRFRNLAALAQSGARPLTLYDIREVQALAKELEEKRKQREQNALVLQASGDMERRRSAPPGQERGRQGIGKLAAFEAVITKLVEAWQGQQRHATRSGKYLLTVEECKDLGFLESSVRKLVREGKLKNFGSSNLYLVSRFDLMALVGGGRGSGSFESMKLRGRLSDKEALVAG